jgi:predicted nucleic-acid-binding protein
VIAVDTNVLVRVVTQDDPEQAAAALAVLRSGELWASKTVLLEMEWVLRYSYKLSREVIARTLTGLLGYRPLQVEDRGAVVRALGWFRQGLDFADALHLASAPLASSPEDRFVTFARPLARAASGLEDIPRVQVAGDPLS